MPQTLDVIIIGASGDLARKKIFPALFCLFSQGLIPENVRFFGFARTRMSDEQFQAKVAEHLTCRYTPDRDCEQFMQRFLKRCHYVPGSYGNRDAFLDLYQRLSEGTNDARRNCLFYLAIPPSLFADVSHAIAGAGLVYCGDEEVFSRVVIEKPFGRDRASSDQLNAELMQVFVERQLYRIDHYLGKEVVQNLLVLRFANLLFQRIWNRESIDAVEIDWSEPIGTEGRGGYYDQYGVIRDVVQNHLLQILAMVTMEQPASLKADDIRDSKVQLLKQLDQVKLEDVALGQYTANEHQAGYTDDPGVPDNSVTPTFAAVNLRINNDRWQGVDFRIRAGKALNMKKTEIRLRFKPNEGSIFCNVDGCPLPNQLVIRVQPEESVFFRFINKLPGLKMEFAPEDLQLSYRAAYENEIIPEAYESLLLDVINGDKSLFIRRDELDCAWDLFTPVLNKLEQRQLIPGLYPFGASIENAEQASITPRTE